MSATAKTPLSILAVLGFLLAGLASLIETLTLEGGSARGLLPLLLASAACLFVIWRAFGPERELLLAHRAVFVPLGIVLGLEQLLAWLSLLPVFGASG